ncbi:hypothetical protein BpHYR1_029401 [Brachionus plicatilis]|uniref:Uncharacterized protein n=1 Tax=Brachionus plicatilis TaxID=10195 RepID=A0A3M7QJD9_BRAPC|nr:hypothetical protein BpHYR1_029401 [Brachionus plicatilis]
MPTCQPQSLWLACEPPTTLLPYGLLPHSGGLIVESAKIVATRAAKIIKASLIYQLKIAN